jgi:uncharacterized protein
MNLTSFNKNSNLHKQSQHAGSILPLISNYMLMGALVRLSFSLIIAVLLFSCKPRESKIKTNGPEIVEFRALPFDMADVKLLDGPFKKATELNIKILLNYEPDRLLAKFRTEAGLKAKAENYHGWEDETIAGHSLGHYLSACALMYKTTNDSQFLKRVNYIVNELKICQDADKNGYIGAFPKGKKILEEEVAKGNIRSAGFDLNGIWVPYYTEHKVMAGLRDAYHLCGNKTALEVEKHFADWLEKIVINLPDSSVQKMLNCEHGGINEVLADLYGDTKDQRYLKMSRIFHHKLILDSLANKKDILPNRHANTQIPKLIGLARRYELTGDLHDRTAAEFFWNTVVHHHSYVTGGNANNEYFGQPDTLRNRLGSNTTETCNVYNMEKLSEHLFEWTASAEVADYYERSLLNHIHSSQNPVDGHVVYNLSLDMGGRKDFQDPSWFTCCIGTGMEIHSKYENSIYYHNNEELFVCQYIASELTWKEKGLKLRQETSFPDKQSTKLVVDCEKPIKLALQIRYPYWAKNGIQITVNGEKKEVSQKPGSFIAIEKKWKKGDIVEVKFPFSLRLETMPDDTNRVAIFYGPVLLAGVLGPETDSIAARDPRYVPVLMANNRNPEKWLSPIAGKINEFEFQGIGKPRNVSLVPFYSIYDKRYTVYWDLFTEESWKIQEAEYKAELEYKKKLEDLTVDFIQPGEMQPERDHKFKGEQSSSYTFKDRPYRDTRGGWFAFDMKAIPNKPLALAVEYWGGFPGSKKFDIMVDNTVIASENISMKKDGQFLTIEYPVPETLTKGKTKVNVRFQARPKNMAGPVFGIRMIKK